ncbi:MAG TPA: heat-inducible transcriptional repressor HrcA [Terriglobales bacterium]|nr:heat-inducible transcriptional repressor HrcA [Terriglobales bacterium]
MASNSNFGPREREVLSAIIEAYIITGEPVGSRGLSRGNSEGLSPASIRNVMSDLTDAGYLEQPHTSAGRVPTAEAYRYYVTQIATKSRSISNVDQGMIDQNLRGAGDLQQFMERTSHVLSLISQKVGVAVAGGPKEVLEHIHFTRLEQNRVLAVVITKSGVVRDKMLRVENELSPSDLEISARYLNDNFRGWTLDALRTELQKRIEQERSEYDQIMKSIAQLYKQGALGDDRQHDVYLEGASNLIGNADQQRLRNILRTLEEKQKIAELLSAYLDANQETVRVVFGLEEFEPQLRDFVLIGAPAKQGGDVVGSLAVIGPMRIDYQHAITAVSYISQLFEKFTQQQ